MLTEILPLHMGALHAHEQWLVVAIAFGPFLLLGVVIAIRRRQDLAEEAETASPAAEDPLTDADARPQG